MDSDELINAIIREAPPHLSAHGTQKLAQQRGKRQRIGTSVVMIALFAGILWGTTRMFDTSSDGPTLVIPGAESDVRIEDLPYANVDQYYYEDAKIVDLGPVGSGGPWRARLWLAPDGSGRFVADEPDPDGHSDVTFTADETSIRLLLLSQYPGGIRAALRDRETASPTVPLASPTAEQTAADMKLLRAFDSQLDPSGENLLDPRSQAGVFDVLVAIPGIVRTDRVSDPLGREAVSVEYFYPGGWSAKWYFTPTTHQLLASEEVSADGTVDRRALVLESGISDSLDQRPSDPLVSSREAAEGDLTKSPDELGVPDHPTTLPTPQATSACDATCLSAGIFPAGDVTSCPSDLTMDGAWDTPGLIRWIKISADKGVPFPWERIEPATQALFGSSERYEALANARPSDFSVLSMHPAHAKPNGSPLLVAISEECGPETAQKVMTMEVTLSPKHGDSETVSLAFVQHADTGALLWLAATASQG